MNVPNFPKGKRPKATDVNPWYGVYFPSDLSVFTEGAKNIAPETA